MKVGYHSSTSSTAMLGLSLLAALLLLFCPTNAESLEPGAKVCVEGFIMDQYCIDLGTLLDNRSVKTLEGPGEHSVHCLVDVGSCVNSPFELLLEPPPAGNASDSETLLFARGFRLTPETKDDIVTLARSVGTRCSTCDGNGDLQRGFRAAILGTVEDWNLDDPNTPPLLSAMEIAHSNGVANPCQELFPDATDIPDLEELLAEGGTNVFAFYYGDGGGSSSGSGGSGRSPLQQKQLIHGSLMLIGWGYLLPSGAIVARFFKHRPNGLWFQCHRVLQTVGLLFAVVGWIIALTSFTSLGDKPYNNYRHAVLGMTTMILGLLQPLNAILRPHAPEQPGETPTKARQLWEIAHKTLGYSALLLAVVTIGYGTTLLPTLENQRTFQYAYAIGAIGLLLILLIGMRLDKSKYESSSNAPAKDATNNDDDEEDVPLSNNNDAEGRS